MRARLKALYKEHCEPKMESHFEVIDFTTLRATDPYFKLFENVYTRETIHAMLKIYGSSEHIIDRPTYPEHDVHLLFFT